MKFFRVRKIPELRHFLGVGYTVDQSLTGSCLSDITCVKNWILVKIFEMFIYGEKFADSRSPISRNATKTESESWAYSLQKTHYSSIKLENCVKCFYQSFWKEFLPSFKFFQAKKVFFEANMPSFRPIRCVVLLQFDGPKINFESSPEFVSFFKIWSAVLVVSLSFVLKSIKIF